MSTETRATSRASAGHTRLIRSNVEVPETVVKLPDGGTMTLRRREVANAMPIFQKFDSKKMNPSTGHHYRRGRSTSGAAAGGGKGLLSSPSVVPFSKVIVMAFLAHQVFSVLKGFAVKTWRWRNSNARQLVPFSQRAMIGGGHDHDVDLLDAEEDLDDAQRAQLIAARRAQTAMSQAMLRNALPKPQRNGLPEKSAKAHHARLRNHITSKKMMALPVERNTQVKEHPSGGMAGHHGDISGVQYRQKGMLGKMDEAVKRETRAALSAATAAKKVQQQYSLLIGGPETAAPAKPAGMLTPQMI
ncbi:hypothetical protein CEUSTIGMA_g8127.t1 [Chlamydomonas eustigma]|uniref:Uncharacterized protein n=1 Tax=Chlamydomonas eustigma TaxID=1157962 RepID=A0A250XCS5_9CHLO|nr:hypothetical protein CEUSTIGMA_g8127.t1 [Chlamydomonas eustigma]|eukprot:GAX80692.1 hypothetical protein CEUSTIGMA_g8127.t1 [Chlamydomonas eustigma]